MTQPHGTRDPVQQGAAAAKRGTNPARIPEQEASGLRPLHLGVLLFGLAGAVAIYWFLPFSPAPAPAPAVSAPAVPAPARTWKGPDFKRFELPTDKVQIRQVGEGFEIINTDPALTGQEMTFKGETADGGTITYTLKIPPPVGEGEGTAQ